MARILPPNRPKISRAEVQHIVDYHKLMFPHKFTKRDQVNVVWIRGYFGKSLGKTAGNDYNVYDDAAEIIAPDFFKSFNANCDPSFVVHPKTGAKLAKLNLGVYPFYKGKHKNVYWAFRAYPEAVVLPCTRAGKLAACQYVNSHYGGENPQSWYVTWSEACLTVPKSQFVEPGEKTGFQPDLYALMERYGQKTINFILVEKVIVNGVEKYCAGNGQIIPAVLEVEQIVADELAESAVETPETSQVEPSKLQPTTISNFSYEELTEPYDELTEPLILECAPNPSDQLPITGTIEKVKETVRGGMDAYETAIKVTSGKTTSFWLQLFGMLISLMAAVFGFLRENWKLIAIGVVGVILLAISIAVIFTVINYLKMKYTADPTKNNVE